MDDSRSNMINLYPERRQAKTTNNPRGSQDKTETSRSFGRSRLNEKLGPRGDLMDDVMTPAGGLDSNRRHAQMDDVEMDDSQDGLIVYPKLGEAETSKSSPNPKSNTRKPSNDNTKSSPTNSHRQLLLSFDPKGKLHTKQPLTNPTPRTDTSRLSLGDIAHETISLLPGLLATRPDVGKAGLLIKSPGPLVQSQSPNLPRTTIHVVDADSITAALALLPSSPVPATPPPLILNMANAQHAGGGFKHGALAQEEALCYRSSLYFTLKIRLYPIPEKAAIYSPRVLIFREAIADGHALLNLRRPEYLPVVAVVSSAAICLPALTKVAGGGYTYSKAPDRGLMQTKMRTILRIAATNGHRRIVLGAFGCGAFKNPPEEVAKMWKEVLCETEFGGWWEEVVFAVLAAGGGGRENFEVFGRVLGGVVV